MNSSGADMIGKPIFLAAVAVTAIGLNAFEAVAQSYPTRPIKMILPFPPGGPIDTMGRLVAQHMSSGLGQNVYIENRAGGGSSIGMRAAATAEPDGYTLLFASSGPLAITPALYKNLDYDPNKNFAPVATVSSGPMVLVVSPALPINSVQELVAYAKSQSGQTQLRRDRRHSAASGLGFVHDADRNRYRLCSVQRRRRGLHRSGRRTDPDEFRRHGLAPAPHPRGQAQGACGVEHLPQSGSARSPHHGGERNRFPHELLDSGARSCRNAT
jgi:hypothetical protein